MPTEEILSRKEKEKVKENQHKRKEKSSACQSQQDLSSDEDYNNFKAKPSDQATSNCWIFLQIWMGTSSERP